MNDKNRIIIKIVIIVALIVAVVFAMSLKNRKGTGNEQGLQTPIGSSGLPRLVDLGADQCIPCKMMAPILSELEKEYEGRFDVVVIDVARNRSAIKEYGVNLIPTQVFYNAEGKELYRHEGFLSKQDILKKWKDLQIDVETKPEEKIKGNEDEPKN